LRTIAALFLLFLTLAVGYLAYHMGSEFAAPAPREVGAAPPDLNAQPVAFAGLKGWFVSAGAGAPCVLLLHGMRADRRIMVERARLLRHAGYSSLLFDFQAHGESPGEQITFGYLESENARSATAFMRSDLGCTDLAAIGISMGGAAALLGQGPLEVDALVLESVYPTIEETVGNHLNILLNSRYGALLTPLLTLQLKPRLGVDPRGLQPIDKIGDFKGPVLIAGGTIDRETTIAETERLFAAANGPKEFWRVAGAAHVDLLNFAPGPYRAKLLDFLARHLRVPQAAGAGT